MNHHDFFRYSRERHNVYLKRRDGEPAPWTDDPVINRTGFTNIFRELDRVTIWFRQNIRDPLRHDHFVVPATAIFRWFNRIETGEAIAPMLREKRWDSREAKALILKRLPKGPWVTGSYMVHSPYGCDKLTGMLQYCDELMEWWENGTNDIKGLLRFFSNSINPVPLLNMKQAHSLLCARNGLAGFTAYEVVTDLRFTCGVNPTDRLTWAHAGPGATRGGSRVLYGEPDRLNQGNADHQLVLQDLMRKLLEFSKQTEYWPQGDPDWPKWEMREVEHTLCEFDKYERVRREQGQAKRVFRPHLAGALLDAGLGGL